MLHGGRQPAPRSRRSRSNTPIGRIRQPTRTADATVPETTISVIAAGVRVSRDMPGPSSGGVAVRTRTGRWSGGPGRVGWHRRREGGHHQVGDHHAGTGLCEPFDHLMPVLLPAAARGHDGHVVLVVKMPHSASRNSSWSSTTITRITAAPIDSTPGRPARHPGGPRRRQPRPHRCTTRAGAAPHPPTGPGGGFRGLEWGAWSDRLAAGAAPCMADP